MPVTPVPVVVVVPVVVPVLIAGTVLMPVLTSALRSGYGHLGTSSRLAGRRRTGADRGHPGIVGP